MPLSSKIASLLLCLGFVLTGQLAAAQAADSSSSVGGHKKATEIYKLEPLVPLTVAYPPEAAKQNAQGEVIAAILVSETGQVENTKVYMGAPPLASAAEQAMKDWKFKPVLVDGQAIPVVARVKVRWENGGDAGKLAVEVAPADPFPTSIRVSSQAMQGLQQSKVAPVYPDTAKRAHIEGTVQLRGVIDKEGNVVDLQSVSGMPELVPAAIDAVYEANAVRNESQVTIIPTKNKTPQPQKAWDVGSNSPPPKSAQEQTNRSHAGREWLRWATVEASVGKGVLSVMPDCKTYG